MSRHLHTEERRQQLLEAALVAFGKRGYHATQVSDIIAEAKVARGTFYVHFEGKREIFAAVVSQIFAEVQAQIQNIPLDAFQEIPSQILGNLRRVTHLFLTNHLYIKLLFSDAVGLDTEFDTQLRRFYEQILDYIRRGLKQGQAMGFVREGDVGVLSIGILGCVKEVFYQYILGTRKPSAKAMERDTYSFVINGIIHPKLRGSVDEILKLLD